MLLPTVCEAAVKHDHEDSRRGAVVVSHQFGISPTLFGINPEKGEIRLIWNMYRSSSRRWLLVWERRKETGQETGRTAVEEKGLSNDDGKCVFS